MENIREITPEDVAMVPMPKEGFCTISLDHYIDLAKAQTRLEDLISLIESNSGYAAKELIEKWKENN